MMKYPCAYKHMYKQTQTGAVLVMSLVLLTVMTLIGVATMSGSSMEMRVASNMQQFNVAFQGAQSRIEFAASASPGNPVNYKINIPNLEDTTTWPIQNCDPAQNCFDGTKWAATATANYKGCAKGYGNSLEAGKGVSLRTFEIDVVATANGGLATSRQGQGVRAPVKACGDET